MTKIKLIDSSVWLYRDEIVLARTYVIPGQLVFTIEMAGGEEVKVHLEHPIVEQMEFIGEF